VLIAAIFLAIASRSARPVTITPIEQSAHFNRDESAGLFVGVKEFTHRDLMRVPYAADDAVDLAHLFVFDRHIRLVRADRVVLALSGDPVKESSRRKLEELLHAGAKLRRANQTNIVSLLRRQAAATGKDGILIVSLATHGFVRAGVPYVLGASSTVEHQQTVISIADVLDTASRSARSLVFIDACRERLSPATRSINRSPVTAAALLRRMGSTQGQAIFFAAAAGQVAYDDDVTRNGVFTHAVIDGLHCQAAKPRGTVTPLTLGTYVDGSVRKWIRDHRGRKIRSAIQLSIDGDARNMPLAQCWADCRDPAKLRIARVTTRGKTVVALKTDGTEAWRHDAGERVRKAFVEDVDADCSNDVIVATDTGVAVFDADGKRLWAVPEERRLRAIEAVDLFRNHAREVITLSGDGESRLSIYSAEGDRISFFDWPERLDHLAVGRPTKQHAMKIVVTAGDIVMAFDPKRINEAKPVWKGKIAPAPAIEKVEIADDDNDHRDDIVITTENGTLALDFKGKVIARHVKRDSLQFHLLHSRRKRP
jgi:hypothetical protein